MKLLVDGDILLYRCAFAAEHTHYLVVTTAEEGGDLVNYFSNHKEAKAYAEPLGFPIWSRKEVQPVEFAIHATNTVLQSLVERFEPESVDIFLSDSSTFRHRLATTKPYKGNRAAPKPVYYDDVKDFLLSRGAILKPDLEADDCLAVEATKDPEGTVMVTTDKDLLQVPGNHYNWVTQTYKVQNKKDADFELAKQLLTGDSTDNVPGLPGVGSAAAKNIVLGATSTKDLFGRVFKAYQDRQGEDWEDYFVEQFGLIYLLRDYGQKEIYETAAVTEQIRGALQGATG